MQVQRKKFTKMSKISLKSQFRSTVLGVVGLLIPSLILNSYSGTNTTVVIILCIGVANLVGYYHGATNEEEEYAAEQTSTETSSL